MKKINLLLLFVSLALVSFSQDDIKKCGQIPHVNPTVKAKCSNDIQSIPTENLPASLAKNTPTKSWHNK